MTCETRLRKLQRCMRACVRYWRGLGSKLLYIGTETVRICCVIYDTAEKV